VQGHLFADDKIDLNINIINEIEAVVKRRALMQREFRG
jgi:hypothetical protein